MLYKILIKDIVLIKNLEIEFKPGLSVLTGETGTGKSILIDSLGLILGNRANFKLIRKGEKKGNVSAIFKINSNHRVNKYLASLNIDILDELIIRRDINIQGCEFLAPPNSVVVGVKTARTAIEEEVVEEDDSEESSDAAPSDAAPSDAAPSDAAPSDAAPSAE